MFETLAAKVALLMTVAMLSGGLGAWLFRNLQNLFVTIGLIIGAIAGIFITMAAFHAGPVQGGISLAVWSFVIGAMAGPALQRYSETLGAQTVFGAFFGTAGVMALCGLIATFSGINFGGLGGILSIGLWGLIIVGVIGIFVRMSATTRIVEGLFGMAIFSGYFLFDFFRMSHRSENSWQSAGELTMNLYLDFWNFLLYLLQVLEASKEKGHAALQAAGDTMVAMLHVLPDSVHHGFAYAGAVLPDMMHHGHAFAGHAMMAMGVC